MEAATISEARRHEIASRIAWRKENACRQYATEISRSEMTTGVKLEQ